MKEKLLNNMVFEKHPSKIIDDYWVHANPKSQIKEITNNCGKWLIFIYTKDLDEFWQKIARATEKGELGIGAKAGTAKENPNATNQDVKVICVYTYNSEDKDDVARIAWKLFDLGVVSRVLNYKKDKVTIEGKYAINGDKKISRYSVSINHFKDKNEKEFIEFFREHFE